MCQGIRSGLRTPRRRSVVLLRQPALPIGPEESCLKLCAHLLSHMLSLIATSACSVLDAKSRAIIRRNIARRMLLMCSPSGVGRSLSYGVDILPRLHHERTTIVTSSGASRRGAAPSGLRPRRCAPRGTAQPCGLRSPRTFLRFCSSKLRLAIGNKP